MRQGCAVDQHQNMMKQEWLTRLARGREVFLYSRELGPACALSTSMEACADLMRPWLASGDFTVHSGRLGIACTLPEALDSLGYGALCQAIRQNAPHRLLGLAWPHCVLQLVAEGDLGQARSVLDGASRWRVRSVMAHQAAASYWLQLFADRQRAEGSLSIAHRMAEGSVVAGFDLGMFFEHEWARLSARLLGDIRPAVGLLERDARAPWAAPEFTVYRLVGTARLAREVLNDPGTCRHLLEAAASHARNKEPAGRAEIAFASAILLGETMEDGFLEPESKGGRSCLEAAQQAFYWRMVKDDGTRVRSSLAEMLRRREFRHPYEGIECASAVMALTGNESLAAMVLEDQESRASSPTDHVRDIFAWKTLVNRPEQMEHRLSLAVSGAAGCFDFIGQAEQGIRWLGEPGRFRALLELAEACCDEAFDFQCLGEAWWQLLGCRDQALSCLGRAGKLSANSHEAGCLARSYRELFGDAESARKALQNARRKSRLKDKP